MLMKRVVAAMVLVAGVACGDDPVAPIERRGNYVLTSVNGQAVPLVVSVPTDDPEISVSMITGGSLVLRDDDTQTILLDVRVTTPAGTGNGSVNFVTGGYTLSSDGREVAFDGTEVVGTFGAGRSRTLTVPMGEPWGTLLFTQR